MEVSLLSLVGFSVAMYITPGPNNLMVAASTANHGIRATMPHMLGINVGFSVMLVVVCTGFGAMLISWPLLLPLFRWGGAAWLLWLAWKIAASPPPSPTQKGRVLGFLGAAAFQWVNPKAWLIGVGAASEFMAPDQPLFAQLLRIFVVFMAVGLPCLMVWAMIGGGARRLLQSPGQLRAFNVAMGLLLVLSVVPVLLEGW
ncbi:MAG: LysE family translocator [Acetobacteraceae bacterium]